MITRRTINKTDGTPALSKYMIFRRMEFNFIIRLKGDFETKTYPIAYILKGIQE